MREYGKHAGTRRLPVLWQATGHSAASRAHGLLKLGGLDACLRAPVNSTSPRGARLPVWAPLASAVSLARWWSPQAWEGATRSPAARAVAQSILTPAVGPPGTRQLRRRRRHSRGWSAAPYSSAGLSLSVSRRLRWRNGSRRGGGDGHTMHASGEGGGGSNVLANCRRRWVDRTSATCH